MLNIFCRVLIVAGLLLAPATRADVPALLDAAHVPHLGPDGRADYARFLLQPTPRVFALSANGAWGWAAAIGSSEATAPFFTTAR